MATYFLNTRPISRAHGSETPRFAAYRAGERIRNERTGDITNHSRRDDVVFKTIVLPPHLARRPEMAWAEDRSQLWNAVEAHESRSNARLAREWLLRLPGELTPEQRHKLVLRFAEELATRQGCAVDVCVHLPRPKSQEDCHHAHLMTTRCQVTLDGFGEDCALELSAARRKALGLEGTGWDEVLTVWRPRWAELINEALERAGFGIRVTHKSLMEQGIPHEPMPTLPKKVFYAERSSGKPHPVGERLRSEQREREAALKISREEHDRVVQEQKARGKQEAQEHRRKQGQEPKGPHWGSLTRLERNAIRRRGRKEKIKQLEKDPAALEAFKAKERERSQAARRANPEKARAYRKAWRLANPEKVRAAARRYSRRHAAEIRAKDLARYWKDPEKSRARGRLRRRIRVERQRILKYAIPAYERVPEIPSDPSTGTGRTPSVSPTQGAGLGLTPRPATKKRRRQKTKSRGRGRDDDFGLE